MEIKKYEKRMDLSFLEYRFGEYLKFSKKKYPKFNCWFNKISSEIGTDKRIVYLAFDRFKNEKKIIGIMILKNTEKEKKICSIYISKEHRKKGIATKFFEKAFAELGTKKPVISVGRDSYKDAIKHLINKYHFKLTLKKFGVYRKHRLELFFNQDTLTKVLLSIKPKYAKQIFQGTKKYELRKKVWNLGTKNIVVVYASEATKKIIGEFYSTKVISDTPEKIWNKYKDKLGISEEEYFKYFEGRTVAYAIKIKNFIKYKVPISLKEIRDTRAPQAYMYLENYETFYEKKGKIKG